MHRTLKAETTRLSAGSRTAQQKRFNTFREEFNHERPHEAIETTPPPPSMSPRQGPCPQSCPHSATPATSRCAT
ncbi:MAG: hypothetical protein M3461_22495 [Pseudomonadota bacterium]|nr:hypothetical protein [Pseudomonadota bacterium]